MPVKKRSLLDEVPFYPTIPHGYVGLKEFVERCNTSRPEVLRCIRTGRIPRESVIACLVNGKGNKRFALNWNKAAYPYLIARQERLWPDDFEPNDEELYHPIPDINEDEALLDAAVVPPAESDKKTKHIVTIADAKLRVEKLKIQKMQAEVRLANNESILMKDVLSSDRELATKLKGIINRAISASASLVAATNSVQACRSILEAQFREAVETINPLNGETHD